MAVITAAMNLRTGIASVAPVLAEVVAAFSASGTFAGIITGLPGAFFAVMGLAAVPLARAVGLSRALVIGMVAMLVGTAWRPWVTNPWAFIGLSGCVVGGIALSNVLLPAWIKRYGGRHIVTLMTVNTSLLGASGAVAPLSALLYDGPGRWQQALFFWVWIALAQVVVWVFVAWCTGFDFPAGGDPAPSSSPEGVKPQASGIRGLQAAAVYTSPTVLLLTAFFSIQSMNAYMQMGYLPQILIDAGVSADLGSLALALVGGIGIVGGLVMPPLISRLDSLGFLVAGMAGCAVAGYAGLIFFAAQAPLVWAALLGFGGWTFPTALALIVARTRSAQVTARVSGFVQPVGYVLPAIGPLLVGVAYRPEDPNWASILCVFLAASVLQGVVGVLAARPRLIDHELKAASAGEEASRQAP
ncbi:MFS transporter [Corynebacterium atypicum]|uniref:MFS transporter n=1 Tax=Corynebacterium atypicum TaxID=191610 RepID=UPI00056DDA6A|nr:MFS transporter [Corynebacterium atypicum]